MLTENEVGQIIAIPEIKEIVQQVYHGFVKEEEQLESINLHDFFSGMLIAPSIAMARVDGSTSLFEELTLNKKARRISKGGFFLTKDPVVKLIDLLQTRWDSWETKFLEALSEVIMRLAPEINEEKALNLPTDSTNNIFLAIARSSYLLVRLLETFFLPEGDLISNTRPISKGEFQKMLSIGDQLQLSGVPSFQSFIKTFEVK